MILASGGKLAINLSPQQIASCAPSTGKYGCMGCNGGFTEVSLSPQASRLNTARRKMARLRPAPSWQGAYAYVKSAGALANDFFIPYGQSLTQTTNTLACPTAKVQIKAPPCFLCAHTHLLRHVR